MLSHKRYYKRLNEMTNEESRVDLDSFAKIDDDVVHCNTDGSKVVEFFEDKCVLITGGTGVLGKLLVEKLLRSCQCLKKIYVLIRKKRNMDISSRIQQLHQSIVFKELRKVQPDFQKKIIPICGDISQPNLGISEADQEMLKNEVNVIFHVAATVKLDEKLKTAIQTNLKGTLEIIHLAKACRNLLSIVYVSTAYSNCMRTRIEERVYTPSVTDDQLLEIVESLGENSDVEEKRILGDWINSYVFTKNMAEFVMNTKGKGLPVCIFRPAIITNAYREPMRGYIDNYYGTVGIIANIFCGIMRTVNLDREKYLENVPADFVVNGLIVAAYKNSILREADAKVYNYVSSVENPLNLGDLVDMTTFFGHQIPTIKSLWYPNITTNSNHYIHFLYTVFLHYLPGCLFDTYRRLCGRKPWMLSFYKKVFRFNESVSFFAKHNWEFKTNNVQELWKELTDVDKKVFPFSMSKELFNWNDYVKEMNLGVRLYLLHDELETLPEAQHKLKKQYYLHVGAKYTIISILLLLVALFVGYTI